MIIELPDVRFVSRQAEYAHLSGEDSASKVYQTYIDKAREAQGWLESFIHEIAWLAYHDHVWKVNEDTDRSYCAICGWDGDA